MKKTRRKFTGAFKAKVEIEALKERELLAELGLKAILFSGMNGSETIYKVKGVKSYTASIKGQSLTRLNSEDVKNMNTTWANEVRNAADYTNLAIEESLLKSEFEILVRMEKPVPLTTSLPEYNDHLNQELIP